MRRRLVISLTVSLVTVAGLVWSQDSVASWLQRRWAAKEEPLDWAEQREVILFDGILDALPLKPRLVSMGSGQSRFPFAEQPYRGLPSWLVITDGYGSGGQLVFNRPLRLTRPLSDYELVLTMVPPVPLEVVTTPQAGQPGAPGMPTAPGAETPGAPGISGPETSGGEAGYAPGVPGWVPFGGAPGPYGGVPSPYGFGAPGFPSGYGGMSIIGGSQRRRQAIRRFVIPNLLSGTVGGMPEASFGGPMGGPYGGMPGGELGPGTPYGPGGLGRPRLGGTAPGMAGATQPTGRQPSVIYTLKHLSLLLVTDKGLFTLSFRVPPDDALTLDDIWANIVVPLQLVGKAPEPPLILYRLGISGDAPDELYIARIALRLATLNQPFLQLRSPALMLPAPAPPGEKPIPRYIARVNQPFTIEAFVTGTVLPTEILWDFTDENGIQPDLPDRRGRQVSFTFDKTGIHECAVIARDIYGLTKPIVERFQVQVEAR